LRGTWVKTSGNKPHSCDASEARVLSRTVIPRSHMEQRTERGAANRIRGAHCSFHRCPAEVPPTLPTYRKKTRVDARDTTEAEPGRTMGTSEEARDCTDSVLSADRVWTLARRDRSNLPEGEERQINAVPAHIFTRRHVQRTAVQASHPGLTPHP
jgi:hypothetical protein